ncbi:hypothetical protein NEAUS04_0444 [Nematocida ausubeli]|nr:hypothetical protein NEAUS04_0444 [Nematocida ausubeli]
MHYKLYVFLSLLYTAACTKTPQLLTWDSNMAVFQPDKLEKKDVFRNAVANLHDLRREALELNKDKNSSAHQVVQEDKEYTRDKHMGYLYSPEISGSIGIQKKAIGYDSVFGVGGGYKKIMFSIYHIEKNQDSPVVFLVNDKKVADYFTDSNYLTTTPVIERIPGLLNSDGDLKIGTGPLLARSFKILGVSMRFKTYKSKKALNGAYDPNLDSVREEIALQSSLNGKFVSVTKDGSRIKLIDEMECNEKPNLCTFFWVPYKEMG